ncbi:MAG: Holliday junction resolvase RuvX [Deltaproteobacteria bacterium]|nr:Holliday junction resolvase RuvX [Deltaproteobacteria bacterium]
MNMPGRVIAIDWGAARIGLAASDPTRTLATPRHTLYEKDKGQQTKKVAAFIVEEEATLVLVGLPLMLDGSDSETTRSARKFAEKLQTLIPVQVVLVDERLSSVEAEELLAESGFRSKSKADKGRIDSAAAAVMLQRWLDTRPRTENA